jgi:hypothetical protein
MQSLSRFLRDELKLTVNPQKSAVDRPWKRKFLGFAMTAQRQCRVRVAPQAVKRWKENLRESFRAGRGRNLRAFIASLKPKLRGWASYCSVAETRNVFEDLDQWVRRKLRCMEWRKWKKPRTRMRRLIALGLDRESARDSAFNGRGPCVVERWGIAHERGSPDFPSAETRTPLPVGGGQLVNCAAPAAVFMNRRDTEPHVRWCGRTAEGNVRLLPDCE